MYVGWTWKRNERIKSKIMKKNKWFQPGTDPRTDMGNQPSGRRRKTEMMRGQDAPVESVIFVPSTRGGVLTEGEGG